MMTPSETLKKLGELTTQKAVATLTFVDRVITVSSSALAFSMTFRASLMGTSPAHTWLLKAAWIGFGICSVFGVLTHLAAVSAIKRVIVAMRNDDEVGAWASAHPFYEFIYRVLFIAFPLSIAALMAFGVMNTK